MESRELKGSMTVENTMVVEILYSLCKVVGEKHADGSLHNAEERSRHELTLSQTGNETELRLRVSEDVIEYRNTGRIPALNECSISYDLTTGLGNG
jgi:hypothetical protein